MFGLFSRTLQKFLHAAAPPARRICSTLFYGGSVFGMIMLHLCFSTVFAIVGQTLTEFACRKRGAIGLQGY